MTIIDYNREKKICLGRCIYSCLNNKSIVFLTKGNKLKTKYLSKKFYQGLKLSIKWSLNQNINHTNRFSYHFLSLRKSKFVKNVPIYHVFNLMKITFLCHSEKLFASLRDIPIDIFQNENNCTLDVFLCPSYLEAECMYEV